MNILELETSQETKSHGDLDFPFNIYPCSIPLDFSSVPDHWHTDMEIIYVKKGQGTVVVDLMPYAVKAGDILCITPGRLHRIEQDGKNHMEYENIIFQLSMLMSPGNDSCSARFLRPLERGTLKLPTLLTNQSARKPSENRENALVPLPVEQERIISGVYPKASRCLDEIDELSRQGDALSHLGIKGKLMEFLYLLLSCSKLPERTDHSIRSLEQMKRILKYVSEHYPEHISIEDMADISGFSCSHFMKFFKTHMDMTFISYLNDYRLTMAARMLTASPDAIAAIAAESGFENLSYFNRQFRKKYGMTPSRYRADFS